MIPQLRSQLELERCPHCSIDSPNLTRIHAHETLDNMRSRRRTWALYFCSRCGGDVIAAAEQDGGDVREVYPAARKIEADLPPKVKSFLQQAVDTVHAPAGSVMLAASAVDSMLKAKGLADGSLYARIDEAAKQHLITEDMALWAHEIRLEANDQRHADKDADLPSHDDAQRCLDFALALSQFLFVLPAKVARGRAAAKQP